MNASCVLRSDTTLHVGHEALWKKIVGAAPFLFLSGNNYKKMLTLINKRYLDTVPKWLL